MTSKELKPIVTSIVEAPSCCPELKEVAQAWLNSLGTEQEAAATEKLMAEAKADITTVDNLIALTGSELGVQIFGEKLAQDLHAHGLDIKSKGAMYCDCPACAGCLAIIEG